VFYRWDNTDLILNIRVQPRASKTELAEIMGDEIKFRITSAPVDGAANQQLVASLAKIFGVARSAVTIVAGAKSRSKRVRIMHPVCLPAVILAAQRGYNESN